MVNIITIIAALNSSALKFLLWLYLSHYNNAGKTAQEGLSKKPLKLYLDQSQHSDCKTNYFLFVCVCSEKNWKSEKRDRQMVLRRRHDESVPLVAACAGSGV